MAQGLNPIDYMRQLLKEQNTPIPPHDPSASTRAEHVAHCLHQLMRFANLASAGHPFRAVQFGLNLGRAQELLHSAGGMRAWWGLYEPLLLRHDYVVIFVTVSVLLQDLGLPQPSNTFLAKL